MVTGSPESSPLDLAAALEARGVTLRVLELDEIRKILTPAPTYSEAEREIVYRALACMARLLTEAGVPVIVDATGHRRAWRELARSLIPAFAEVQLLCPVEVCRERERQRRPGYAPRAIYAQAGSPGATVPGVDVPYEVSLRAELTLNTDECDLWTQIQEILYVVRRVSRAAVFQERRLQRRFVCE